MIGFSTRRRRTFTNLQRAYVSTSKIAFISMKSLFWCIMNFRTNFKSPVTVHRRGSLSIDTTFSEQFQIKSDFCQVGLKNWIPSSHQKTAEHSKKISYVQVNLFSFIQGRTGCSMSNFLI